MFIKSIYLNKFRNYDQLKIDFKNGINIIVGENGQGKTNLLESIYVLGLTKSHRSFIDNNLVKEGESKSIIQGIIEKENISTKYEIEIGNNKVLKIDNDKIKTITDYISNINIIIFYPDDLEIIKGSPNLRRRYVNMEISQLYSSYMTILNDYNKLLKMRNDYLKNNYIDDNYLNIITNYLIEKATQIIIMRKKFIDRLNEIVPKIYEDISELSNFSIKYKCCIKLEDYNEKNIVEKLKNMSEELRNAEFKYKTTLFGPHKDDIEFYLKNYNLKLYGSQGQQRMAILALKLAEIEIFKKYKNTLPILLLDDVFSELDDKKKNNLLNYINENIQTIITTTDINNINNNIVEKSNIIEIFNGNLK